mgnify:CR=1 FL=1
MFLIITAIIVLIIDQASKALVRSLMAVGESFSVIPGILYITYVRNSGAAFGLLPNQKVLFFIISLTVIIFILYYNRRMKIANRLLAISLGSLLGGAAGNLIDRLFVGMVTDFIDFRVWPVFNIADSAIVISVILIAYILLTQRPKEESHH